MRKKFSLKKSVDEAESTPNTNEEGTDAESGNEATQPPTELETEEEALIPDQNEEVEEETTHDDKADEERKAIEKRIHFALEKVESMGKTYQMMQQNFEKLSKALEDSGEISRDLPEEPAGSETGHLASPEESVSHKSPSNEGHKKSKQTKQRQVVGQNLSGFSENLLPVFLSKIMAGDPDDSQKAPSRDNKEEYLEYLISLMKKFQNEAEIVFQLALHLNDPETEQNPGFLINLLMQQI